MSDKEFVPVTHHRPDEDEYLALRIIERWGAHEFPGIVASPLYTDEAGLRLSSGETGDAWLANGYVCIGIGGGRFDEHGKGDGKSAASMAADYFGVSQDEALKPILAYSLRADDRAQDHPFNLASIIKNLHARGVDRETIRRMYNRWLDALYSRFRGDVIFSEAPRATLQKMSIGWLASRYASTDKRFAVWQCVTFADALEAAGLTPRQTDEVREIQRFVDRNVSKGALTDFDFGGLVRAMQFTGVPESAIVPDVWRILDAKARVQRDFITAQTYFRERTAHVAGSPVPVMVIRSDNEQMSRAARRIAPNLAVLIQFRSSGHVRIFGDQRHCLRPVLARLRALERRKKGLTDRLSWSTLSEGGTLTDIPEWYGFEKYGKVIHVFNSTLKAPRTRQTRLSQDEVVRCVREGFAHSHRAHGSQK